MLWATEKVIGGASEGGGHRGRLLESRDGKVSRGEPARLEMNEIVRKDTCNDRKLRISTRPTEVAARSNAVLTVNGKPHAQGPEAVM